MCLFWAGECPHNVYNILQPHIVIWLVLPVTMEKVLINWGIIPSRGVETKGETTSQSGEWWRMGQCLHPKRSTKSVFCLSFVPEAVFFNPL